MRRTTLFLMGALVLLCLPAMVVSSSADSKSFSLTYVNNSGAAATGFQWWFSPDCTASNMTSTAFTSASAISHSTADMVEIVYSNGSVSGGGSSATFGAKLSNKDAYITYARWMNGLAISSTNLPCSFGGSYPVQVGQPDRQWILPIDNPSHTLDDSTLEPIEYTRDLVISSLKYAVTNIQLTPSELISFSPTTWDADPGPSGPISPGNQYDLEVTTGLDEFVVVDCMLNNGLDPQDENYVEVSLRYQVVPEPSIIVLLGMGAVALLLGRRRK